MKKLILFCSLLLAIMLAACGGISSSEETLGSGDGPLVTVYRAPS